MKLLCRKCEKPFESDRPFRTCEECTLPKTKKERQRLSLEPEKQKARERAAQWLKRQSSEQIAAVRAYQKEWKAKNSRRYKDCKDVWYVHNRQKQLDKDLVRKYGISREDFDKLLISQDGRCAICGGLGSETWDSRLGVDHDHKTGEVRGLLCGRCNSAIGLMRDDPATAKAAARYLEKSCRSMTTVA